MIYPYLDQENQEILNRRIRLRMSHALPEIGDYVIFLARARAGTFPLMERIAHEHGEYGIQTCEGGTFYLAEGYTSHSGGLNPTIDTALLVNTGETKNGTFWFFNHDRMMAHNALDVTAPCRVYTYDPEA